MKSYLISILIIFLLLPAVAGQEPVKKQYKATHITIPPVINGILDEETWQKMSKMN